MTSTPLDNRLVFGTLGIVPTTIYALCEPDLQVPVIRYIGKTGGTAAQRLRGHLSNSAKRKSHLGCWLRSLKARGELPVWMTLTEVPDEIGSAAEILYIRLAKEGGMDLVNATEGGEGVLMTPEIRKKIGDAQRGEKSHSFGKTGSANPFYGHEHSSEQKAKWSEDRSGEKHPSWGIKAPKERGQKISAALRGRKLSPERLAKMRGRVVSQETRDRQSLAARRRVRSPMTAETKEKIGRANRNRSGETLRKLRTAWAFRSDSEKTPFLGRSHSSSSRDKMCVSWELRRLPYFIDGGGI